MLLDCIFAATLIKASPNGAAKCVQMTASASGAPRWIKKPFSAVACVPDAFLVLRIVVPLKTNWSGKIFPALLTMRHLDGRGDVELSVGDRKLGAF